MARVASSPQPLVDLSIDCSSSGYKSTANVALFLLFAYGFGVPALLVVLGVFFKKRGGLRLEYSMLSFLLLGYRRSIRYWETVNMMRCAFVNVVVCVCVCVPVCLSTVHPSPPPSLYLSHTLTRSL